MHEAKMDLTREQTINFIRLIKRNKLLWNPEHPEYSNKEKKRTLWDGIARYFNKTEGALAYRKYRQLLNSYTTALGKAGEAKKEKSKPPKLYYFSEMSFLRGLVENQKPTQAPPLAEKPAPKKAFLRRTTKAEQKISNLQISSSVEMRSGKDLQNECDFDNPYTMNNELLVCAATLSTATGEKAVANVDGKPLVPSEGFVAVRSHDTNSVISDTVAHNEYEAFSTHVATQLRQLTKLQAMELMYEIQAIITQKRILIINRDIRAHSIARTQKAKKL